MTLAQGTRLGPYEILASIGAGGMGEIYKARDTRLERTVAIKVLPTELSQNPEALSRFEKEARAVAALSHPNILSIHDFGEDRGIAYAVMELLEGETLREKLNGAELTIRKSLEYGLQIAQGLAGAHEKGIVHRDLKPENVFVTRDGQVKILDFGLAKTSGRPLDAAGREQAAAGQHPTAKPGLTAAPTLTTPTRPGTILGTVGYMSPEQVRGAAVDHRSDVFSFGAILYEMLSGARAFRRETDIESMMAILREEPPDVARSGAAVSTELSEIVAHCLEKSPDERFQSVRDLAFALRVVEREGRSGETARPTSGPRAIALAAGPSEASIAVLPFRNMSMDRENEYFSDGMTEEIINALSKIEALSVASRTSSFAFKGKDEDVRKIGVALGVRTVLEGSVRQSGRKLRITAQLVNVADGYHLWSERYDREMEDVFAVQDEIARSITETLKVRLLPTDHRRMASRGTENVEAYNDYLKGRYYFNRREPVEAIREFERAIGRDPRYTPAYTGLADSYCIYGFYGGISTRDAFTRARKAAETARQLDPESSDAHVSLALVEHYFGWDVGREEEELRRAIELAPRSGAPYSWLGLVLSFVQRHSEALELARRAAELEPLSANARTNVGWPFFASRRFEDAVREFRQALHIDPMAPYPLWALGLTYRFLDRYDEAAACLEKVVAITGRRQSFYVGLLGAVYAAAGRRQDAVALLEELTRRSSQEYIAPFHVAFIQISLGLTDEAFASLEQGCAERNALIWWWIRDNVMFDPIRSDSRFPGLAAKLVPE